MNEQQIREIVRNEIKKNSHSGSPIVARHNHDGVSNTRVQARNIVPVNGGMGLIKFNQSATYTLYFPASGCTSLSFNGYVEQAETSIQFVSGFSAGSFTGALSTVWGESTESLLITFSSGDVRSAQFTSGSFTVTWSVALTRSASSVVTSDSQQTAYALVVGTAILKNMYYFQPKDNLSVKTGGIPYPITQNGAYSEPAQSCSSLYIDTTNLANLFPSLDQFNLIHTFNSSGSIARGNLNNLTTSSVDLVVTLTAGWQIKGNFTIT